VFSFLHFMGDIGNKKPALFIKRVRSIGHLVPRQSVERLREVKYGTADFHYFLARSTMLLIGLRINLNVLFQQKETHDPVLRMKSTTTCANSSPQSS
jgi:hypothetical protein